MDFLPLGHGGQLARRPYLLRIGPDGRIGKWEWIEKWFHVSEEKLLKQKSKIDKYGSWIALITWLPFVGDVFAIGLGFYKLNFAKCAVFMLIGKGARFAIWILLFYLKTQL